MESYKAALALRADNIKTLLEQREQLQGSLKETIAKSNQLVGTCSELDQRYAEVVTRYNDVVARLQATLNQADTGSASGK